MNQIDFEKARRTTVRQWAYRLGMAINDKHWKAMLCGFCSTFHVCRHCGINMADSGNTLRIESRRPEPDVCVVASRVNTCVIYKTANSSELLDDILAILVYLHQFDPKHEKAGTWKHTDG